MTIKASCHCGNVKFEINTKPDFLISCNCSICSKLSTLWTHAAEQDVVFSNDDDATLSYVIGEGSLSFHTCKNCGCTTHWWSVKRGKGARMAVNLGLLSPDELKSHRIRHFDGADKWEFLD
ncbi:MAG: GFA family protein [Hyphomicrobiales bacterium]